LGVDNVPQRRQSQPIRYQVLTAIRNLLAEKNYQPGSQIPTELELMELLDVSRSSLREGLQLLEQDGVISTRRGSGRYLNLPPTNFQFDISRLQGVTDMMQLYGVQVGTRVLDVKEVQSDVTIAQNLEIDTGDPVVWVERVRSAGSTPIIYSIDILPKQRVPGEVHKAEFEGSLLKILEEKWNIHVERSRATIRAVTSLKEIPDGVINDPSMPWIMMEQTNYDSAGVPVIYSKDFHRGDSVVFYINRRRY
jgi:GntR family transcriptional regulator